MTNERAPRLGSRDFTDASWMTEGACNGRADIFDRACDSEDPASPYVQEAKRICGNCDVRSECLQWAVANKEPFGIYGGTTPGERQGIKRRSKTHCPQGHELTGDNAGVDGRGWRYCRTCKNASRRARRGAA